jgi:hypothetical protein
MRAGRVKSTDKLPRIYGPNDPRAERGSRLGAVRARRTEEAAEAAQAAAETAVEEVEAGLTFADFAGTAFPEAPTDGRLFTRTDLDTDMFVWDETRQKWLGTSRIMAVFSAQTNVLTGAFFRLFQAPTTSSTVGFRMPYDATIVEVNSSRVTSGAAAQFDVRVAAGVVLSHTVGAGVVTADEEALDVDVAADDVINCVAGTDVSGGGHIAVIFRRRAS